VEQRIEVGTEVGGYRVIRLIGEGGMGAVYEAEELETGRHMALKFLLSELARDEQFRSRFERESRYAASLNHPNIVHVYEVSEADGLLYMVMDYVPGVDLGSKVAQEGPLEPDRAVALLEQVASALDAVHATGLYHRDVKPGNVIVTSGDGEELHCYLTDFGLSKNPSQDSRPLTALGFFVGTSDYTAPEQILAKEMDHRVDVYSLGCLLYQCLTGEPPFRRPSEEKVLYAHINDPPPKVTERRPEMPAEIDKVVARALAKDPDERHASCGELVAVIRAAIAPAPMPAVGGASPELQSGTPQRLRLKVTEGNAQGTEIQVEDEFVIGREAEAEGKLSDDAEISRRHARISRKDGSFVIEDLGSTNGTVVNGRRISAPEVLSTGDKVEVGQTTLVVQVSAPPPSTKQESREAAPEASPAPAPEPPTEESAAEPVVEPAAEPAGREVPPPVSLRLQFDPASGEVRIELDEKSEPLRLVYEEGRWRPAGGTGE
jgi:serine/threonine protein kinase